VDNETIEERPNERNGSEEDEREKWMSMQGEENRANQKKKEENQNRMIGEEAWDRKNTHASSCTG